jgi:hypothetical protein
MYYHTIDRYSQTIEPLIEAIQLEQPIEVAELKRRFPNLRGAYIDFSSIANTVDFLAETMVPNEFNYYDYLDDLFKTLPLEELTLLYVLVVRAKMF